jgi:phosphate transport system protein
MLDLGSAQPVDSIHFSASVTTELFAARKPAAGVRRDGHILRAVDRAVADLRGHVVGLGSMTVEQMDLGVGALLQCNPLASAEALSVAKAQQELDRRIDLDTFRFIALYQPVAKDLRLIRGLSRIGADFGRIGAEGVKIAQQAPELIDLEPRECTAPVTSHLRHAATLAVSLLRNAVCALTDCDQELARHTVERGAEFDGEFESALRRLLTFALESENQRRHTYGALVVLKGLERVADYARNVAAESLAVLA